MDWCTSHFGSGGDGHPRRSPAAALDTGKGQPLQLRCQNPRILMGEPTGSVQQMGRGRMDSLVFAMVRQIAASWYALALTQGCGGQQATDTGIMQASLFLSDLGIVDGAAPYLDGARDAMRTAEGLGFGRVH
ncbi:hypothetical protein GCM10010844_44050 [Deinococcus radiotolerans]|uniref:Uncharacterized protein n=1 Tax=Deinococcus radiotolerans TaxID=1309407 RepID=A0ABQ2FRQ9_9DEIO|nr:hypothetical protein GCM10010844_44050 [Deinococcus radiotolerans]